MKFFLLIFVIQLSIANVFSSTDDVLVKTRYNYYTTEDTAQLLIHFEEQVFSKIILNYDDTTIIEEKLSGESPYLFSFPITHFPMGKTALKCKLISTNQQKEFTFILHKLEPKFNEVKIDYFTQSLIVHDLPYIPFGFYNYWPVQPSLAEEEVVKGFNMMSPYQRIEKETLQQRRDYMDRCAELGMKVNYNLCSLGGGGGVGSSRLDLTEDEIMEKLKQEILEFKDHPALLAWYIADEPELNKVDPKLLQRTYNVIKEIDPYHPVSIVFMHSEKAIDYHKAMDIVMADPYPIPQGSVNRVRNAIKKLHEGFRFKKPVWVVPQAFGGNEWWPREPTRQEIRIMTYLAIFEQATGVQYFIRSGLNAFPKSTYTWAECGAIAHEVAQLTPYLTQFDKVQALSTSSEQVLAKRWIKDGKEIIIVLNTKNEPAEFKIDLESPQLNTEARVLFENRKEKVRNGTISSFLGAYGTQVYGIHFEDYKDGIHPKNIALDPSFEMNPSVGIPSNCYVTIRGDKGASYFIDSREAYHGEHSIRLTCPTEDNGAVLKFYRQRLQQNRSYTLSIWAKALPVFQVEEMEPRVTGFWNRIRHFFRNLFRKTTIIPETKRNVLRLRIDDVAEEFDLTQEWQQYSVQTTIKEAEENTRIRNPFVQMTGVGVSWIDLMELIPDMEMEEILQMDKQQIEVRLHSNHDRGRIYYRLIKETDEAKDYVLYENPIFVNESALLQAKIKDNEEIVGAIQKDMYIHKAVGSQATYRFPYAANYDGGGKQALVNAKFATTNYKNRNWQGFIGNNLDIELDLRQEKTFSKVKIGSLHDIHAWIFLPEKILLYQSQDGENYQLFHAYENPLPGQNPSRFIQRFEFHFKPVTTRYLRVVAQNVGKVPDWHRGAGGGAWLFVDEIEVD